MVLNSRYSQHARRALNQARMLARDYQHGEVDTDHLFVGILRESGSVGAQVLGDLGIDMRRAELEVRVLHSVADLLVTPLTLTPALDRVLALSVEESHWFSHHYIGTEHLLLALARHREGRAITLLRTLGLSPDQVRRRVKMLLNEGVTELSIEAAKRTARLSELSRRVLNAAGQLDNATGARGLIHLLLVLAREQRSMASHLLRECGLDVDSVQAALPIQPPHVPTHSEAVLEDVIDHAVNRADQLGMHYTGTEHILLALVEHPQGVKLLQTHGVNTRRLMAAIYDDLLADNR